MDLDTIVLLDYVGVFAFAITGALLAEQKEMDIFGFVVLALMPAVGGGTIRDLVLDVPVFWTKDTTYLFLTLAAALITFFGIRFVDRYKNALVWLDALGLSVFCAIGTATSMSVLGDPVVSVVMGVITAVAGGILRDVIANEPPLVLHREVYATAAFLGSLVYVFVVGYEPELALWAAILAAFTARSLGLIFGWSLPVAGKVR